MKSKDVVCIFVLSVSLCNWLVPTAAYERGTLFDDAFKFAGFPNWFLDGFLRTGPGEVSIHGGKESTPFDIACFRIVGKGGVFFNRPKCSLRETSVNEPRR